MHLSHTCRPKVANTLRFIRCLNSSSSVPNSSGKSRQTPIAMDLDGISLDLGKSPEPRRKGFTPNLKDLGQADGHVDQLLSVRLQRRLPESQQQSQAPDPVQRPRQTTRAPTPNIRPSVYRPNFAGRKKVGPGTPRKANRPGRSRGPIARMDQADIVEPEVPLIPAELPARIYNRTNLATLTAPSLSTTKRDVRNSDPVQRVREKVGGDYSQWMSEEDIAAAGKDEDVSAIARARLALAFNPTISPKDRKKLIDTAQMLLSRSRPSGSATSP